MKKTSPYIDPEIDHAMDQRAATEGITKAELIRRALANAVSQPPRLYTRGVFEEPRDLGSGAERYLTETDFGEE